MNFFKKIITTLLLIFFSTHLSSEDFSVSEMEAFAIISDLKLGKIDFSTALKKFPKKTIVKKMKETSIPFIIFDKLPRADQIKCVQFANLYPTLINDFLLICVNIAESIIEKKNFDLTSYKTIKKTIIHEINKLKLGTFSDTDLEKLPITPSKRAEAKAIMNCIANSFEKVLLTNKKITSMLSDDMKEQLEDNMHILKNIFLHQDVIDSLCEYLHLTDMRGLYNLIKNSTFTQILNVICNLIPKKVFDGTKMFFFDDTKSLHMTQEDIDALDDLIDIDFDDFDLE